jgi:squalene-hopene/tetraprenyl-beta-curcumene cyclase
MTYDAAALDRTISTLRAGLLARRTPDGHWEGCLASSALSTAVATVALSLDQNVSGRSHRDLLSAGAAWLVANQNHDGGWGDTVLSASNLSTTVLCWAALSTIHRDDVPAKAGHYVRPEVWESLQDAERWIAAQAGDLRPETLSMAILAAYGQDRTFSAPILTVLALTGKLGPPNDGWHFVPQLPFELAACPHRWFEWLRLPVVSYALPALVAIGQVRHHHKPTRNVALALMRSALKSRTREVAQRMQPASGGFLEATPLTAFVVMSLLASAGAQDPIVERGVRFLRASVRPDGSWPIDSNLATWVTTLAIGALTASGDLADDDRKSISSWLLQQQAREEHPFTHANPGGWAWTDLPGGVPDADDTAGALVALWSLGNGEHREAAAAGIEWLLNLQNRDGGIPTFCRGWGALPFDRSAPDLTAHALEAWSAWHAAMPLDIQQRIAIACRKAVAYLESCQAADGSWIPLWFGNEEMPGHVNPTYGTARVVTALDNSGLADTTRAAALRKRGLNWLLRAQNTDGGWGGGATRSSIEETAVAVQAVAGEPSSAARASLLRGLRWLVDATKEGHETPAAPIGLYFARLWYYEELYPLIFSLAALSRGRAALNSH